MARGWHYAKLSLSNAPRLSFSGLCILLFLFLSLCRFLCVCDFFLLSLELGRCPSDLFLSSRPLTGQPRVLLSMVEARSVINDIIRYRVHLPVYIIGESELSVTFASPVGAMFCFVFCFEGGVASFSFLLGGVAFSENFVPCTVQYLYR